MQRSLSLTLVGVTLTAGLGLAAAAPAPLAQERDRQQVLERLLRRYDLDLDGTISEEEFPRSRRAFRRLDRDRDGALTRADFAPRDPSTGAAPGDEAGGAASDADAAFFEERVLPILEKECYSCHSSGTRRLKGDLRVDSRASLLAGGATGPAIVPGDLDASLLIEAVRYEDPIFAMPPREALPDEAVRDLERWVEMGAPWPSAADDVHGTEAQVVEDLAGSPALDREIDLEEGRQAWSFQTPTPHEAPDVADADWAWTDVDRFLLAAMEERGVEPVEDADRRTWLRRVTFDLTGLPPTPEEIDAFVGDGAEGAYERVVDRLLASPAFGERFGRHWLDVARYGESSGKQTNIVYPHAWRYRDFVIDAVNADMPYDEFLRKQIAGDLLEAEDADERAENLVATGYLAIGPKSHNERDPRQFAVDLVDEQIDAMSQGVIGLTLSCARCHDHKFDPVPIEDYYALAGIFMSTETRFGTRATLGNRRAADLIDLPDGADVAFGPTMDSELRRFLDRTRRRLNRSQEMSPKTSGDEPLDRLKKRVENDQIDVIGDLLERFDESGRANAKNRLAMGAVDGIARDIAVLERGELDRPGDVVPRGFPQVLDGEWAPEIESGSGRLELSEWITDPQHPLTARVWVNRVWLHLFGAGIVRTPDNFGAGGMAPDHPELLDRLAHDFVAGGWSTKSLVRELVLTHAYRLASSDDESSAAVDPEAVTRWRMPDRRLEAEAIRDAMLVVSGTLDPERPVGSPTGAIEGTIRREELADYLTRERPVRSIYLPSLRGHLVDALDVFDAPDSAFVCGDREETSVATQALYLMNDADVVRLADAFAERVMREADSERARIERAFELAVGREPSRREKKAVSRFLADFKKLEPSKSSTSSSRRGRRRARESELARPKTVEHAAWSAFAQTLFQSAEFRAIG
ncbi:MAG: DUF1549 domain-containing protein [Planctomycetota bacterium]